MIFEETSSTYVWSQVIEKKTMTKTWVQGQIVLFLSLFILGQFAIDMNMISVLLQHSILVAMRKFLDASYGLGSFRPVCLIVFN